MNISHNLQAMNANRSFAKSIYEQRKAMDKISSGLKVNKAGDNPAAMDVSNKLKSQIRGMEKAIRNSEDGISLVKTAQGGLAEIQNHLLRMRELCIQAANGTLTEDDRVNIQKEITHSEKAINDIARYTEFNNINVLAPPIDKEPSNFLSGKSDIIFVIDKTGSMGEPIGNVKNNIENFLDKLRSNNIDVRLGIVAYGDINDSSDENPLVKYDFTANAQIAKEYISNIVVDGGGDFPESGLEGIKDGALTYDFRNDATKNFILVTDATVHNEEGDSKYTISGVVNELKDKQIKLTVVGPIDGKEENIETFNQLKELSDSTGGKYLDIYSEFASQLEDLDSDIIEESGKDIVEGEMREVLIQKGANANDLMSISLLDSRTEKIGVGNLTVLSLEEAEISLGRVDDAIDLISRQRALFGTYDNTLEIIYNNLGDRHIYITSANSKLTDVDIAKEMLNLGINNVLSNSSQIMLTQSIRVAEKLKTILDNWR